MATPTPVQDRSILEEFEGHLSMPGVTSQLLTWALAALSNRMLVWAAAIMGGVVWTLAVIHPEVLRLVAAGCYCLTVLVPVLIRDAKGG